MGDKCIGGYSIADSRKPELVRLQFLRRGLQIKNFDPRLIGSGPEIPLVFQSEYSPGAYMGTHTASDTGGPFEGLIVLCVGAYINSHLAICRTIAA